MFVDRVILYVKGGDGGNGCCSFRREKYVPKGGPDGGDGGDGGDVVVRTEVNADSLAGIVHCKHWRAPNGGPGGSDKCHGSMGRELVIEVPPGTLVYDRDRGNLLRDLTEPGQDVVVAKGGRGGRGNKAFATATNRAPRQTQPGTPGEERWIILELKMIAQAGLIGLPNAGKSTLLSRVSRAQPEIADYPSTKYPHMGLVPRGRQGLRAGRSAASSKARGNRLGHEFCGMSSTRAASVTPGYLRHAFTTPFDPRTGTVRPRFDRKRKWSPSARAAYWQPERAELRSAGREAGSPPSRGRTGQLHKAWLNPLCLADIAP